MRKIKNLTAKKLVVLIVGFLLLVATVSGVLFGAKRNAYAQSSSSDLEQVEYVKGPITITDMGALDNYYYEFDCNTFPSVSYLQNNGYKYVTVTLEFMMREIDDGYQEVFLCKNLKPERLTMVKMNYYGNRKIDVFHSVFVGFMSISLNDFLTSGLMNIIIRFDGAGAGDDDWQFKDMSIKVKISKEVSRTDNLKSDYS